MHKKTYINYINQLKTNLKNHKMDKDKYSIGDLEFIFDKDEEGFYDKNTLIVYDLYSNISLRLYFSNEHYCGVSISPSIKCKALMPDIIGEINLEKTFEKLLYYIACRQKYIKLYYIQDINKKTNYYSGVENLSKNFVINNFDPKNQNHYKILKDIFGKSVEAGDVLFYYKGVEYRFEIGTNPLNALNVDEKDICIGGTCTKEDVTPDTQCNEIFYPDILISFTNYEDMINKFKIFQERIEREINNVD